MARKTNRRSVDVPERDERTEYIRKALKAFGIKETNGEGFTMHELCQAANMARHSARNTVIALVNQRKVECVRVSRPCLHGFQRSVLGYRFVK